MNYFVKPQPMNESQSNHGLRQLTLQNATSEQVTACPGCKETLAFVPEQMMWDIGDSVEFTVVRCPHCELRFDINAHPGASLYDYYAGV